MFTGIIEDIGIVESIKKIDTNLEITVKSNFTEHLKIDESVAHNGICLTVVSIQIPYYTVVAIDETINKTNIGTWKVGDFVNLERAMILGSRLDGHIVQGHVDGTAICEHIVEKNGSVEFTFCYPTENRNLVIEKGSICVNGTSLTAFNCIDNKFTVAIIPYTYEHTTIKYLTIGSIVNLEYDIIGKYILRQNTIS